MSQLFIGSYGSPKGYTGGTTSKRGIVVSERASLFLAPPTTLRSSSLSLFHLRSLSSLIARFKSKNFSREQHTLHSQLTADIGSVARMATGVEATGLLLAILPLFIEGAKACKSSVHSIRQARKQTQVDKALEEFYDNFHREIVAINCHVDSIYGFLLNSIDRDILPRRTDFLSKWKNTPAIQYALENYFGSKGKFRRFSSISHKIVQHLDSLINDKTTKLSNEDKVRLCVQLSRRLRDLPCSYALMLYRMRSPCIENWK